MMSLPSEPSLRFSKFNGKWSFDTLGRISSLVKDGTHGTHKNISSPYLLLSAKNLKNGLVTFDESDRTISEDEFNGIYKNYKLQKGDILLSVVGSIGRTAIFDGNEYIAFQRSVAFFRMIDNVPSFTYQFMNSQHFQNELLKRQVVSAQPGIYLGDLSKIKVSIPILEEQKKIADFLSAVDKKISLLKEKHALLGQYKKGVMQKLFSQEVRFKDENGNDFPDWQVEPIGKYLEEYKERVTVNTDIPVLTSSRTGLYLQERKVINEGEYGVVPKGYFTYRHMSDDLVFKFNLNRIWDKGAVSKEYPVFKTVGMNSYFLELSLNEGNDFKRFAIQQKVGGTRTRLYYKNLVKLKLNTPSLDEQNKIADFLQAIDKKLELVSQLIEHTQTFKKGLLQQMFV
ncbi:restriction endonuclease subunit S [Vibrio sp. 2-Bac 85]